MLFSPPLYHWPLSKPNYVSVTCQPCFHVALLQIGAYEHRTSADVLPAGPAGVQLAPAGREIVIRDVVIVVVDVDDVRVSAAKHHTQPIGQLANQIFVVVTVRFTLIYVCGTYRESILQLRDNYALTLRRLRRSMPRTLLVRPDQTFPLLLSEHVQLQ